MHNASPPMTTGTSGQGMHHHRGGSDGDAFLLQQSVSTTQCPPRGTSSRGFSMALADLGGSVHPDVCCRNSGSSVSRASRTPMLRWPQCHTTEDRNDGGSGTEQDGAVGSASTLPWALSRQVNRFAACDRCLRNARQRWYDALLTPLGMKCRVCWCSCRRRRRPVIPIPPRAHTQWAHRQHRV